VLLALGYVGLVVAILVETAGVPAPGESALLAASVLAAAGRMSIVLVVAGAAAAAIAGDNMGYLLGRRFARPLLTRGGRFSRHRRKLLACGERFFARHGAKAVFVGRWLPFARVTAAWLAGATRMPWRTFAPFNALGGIAWAASVGGAAYALGASGARALTIAGAIGLVLMVALVVRHWRTCGRNAPDRSNDRTTRPSGARFRTHQPNTSGGTHAY
jgi:membrane-associated protein